MRRHLPRLLLLGALLSPATLYALGLGEIRPHSALNQPFDAEIELISPTADELAGLKVGLASPDMYHALRHRPADVPVGVRVLGPAHPRWPRQHQDHFEPLGHRAVRHAAGRSELGAWPSVARVHRIARPAGVHAVAARGPGAGHDAAGGRAERRPHRAAGCPAAAAGGARGRRRPRCPDPLLRADAGAGRQRRRHG